MSDALACSTSSATSGTQISSANEARSQIVSAVYAVSAAMECISSQAGDVSSDELNVHAEQFVQCLKVANTSLRSEIRQSFGNEQHERVSADARDRLQLVALRASLMSAHLSKMAAALPPASALNTQPLPGTSDGMRVDG
uniref:Uncharacterized protein n=1 Tax=Chrysotila carterae TaxID=13221 RepID=A0A7S4EV09_CHRCT|mmetsp:Transcript_58468/g.126995  ORF Transcript_58468/g.126995 Transcript_58468/m.126995 type:complete len:140 (+) Transcript_58468:418-837(+)|eukprot:6198189-Pleurochrysis_carterae.AAC.2